MLTLPVELRGKQFAVSLSKRGPEDPHIVIQLMSEDDEQWFPVGNAFSSYWIEDLLQVLELAQFSLARSDKFEKDPSGYGYQLKAEHDAKPTREAT